MSNNTQQMPIIEQWIKENISRSPFLPYDDLHIDEIDSSWDDRTVWLSAGIEALRIGNEACHKLAAKFHVVLFFSLKGDEAEAIRQGLFRDGLGPHMDHSPPSLYLFEIGHEPWNEPDQQGMEVLSISSEELALIIGETATSMYAVIMGFLAEDTGQACSSIALCFQ